MTEDEFCAAFQRMLIHWGHPKWLRTEYDEKNRHLPSAADFYAKYRRRLGHIPADVFDLLIDRAIDEPQARPFPSIPFLRQLYESIRQPEAHRDAETRRAANETAYAKRLAFAKRWAAKHPDAREEIERRARAMCGNHDYLWEIELIRTQALNSALMTMCDEARAAWEEERGA